MSNRLSTSVLTVLIPPLAIALAVGAGVVDARAQAAPEAALTPPVTVNYGGSADAFKVTTTGTGRAIYGVVSNAANSRAAVLGQTNGSGPGVIGQANGVNSAAGRFLIMPTANAQPALFASTKGVGPAVSALVEHNSGVDSAAVRGTNNLFTGYGYGGDFRGGFVGVYASAANGYGLYAAAPAATGYAGYFSGNVYIAGNLTYTSDRAQKTAARDVDGAEVLELVARLPMQSWALREQPEVRHIGPYAQDFHAAFGLGRDEVSISPVDVSGVTLVAVQELHRRLARQDEEIRALKAQLADLAAGRR